MMLIQTRTPYRPQLPQPDPMTALRSARLTPPTKGPFAQVKAQLGPGSLFPSLATATARTAPAGMRLPAPIPIPLFRLLPASATFLPTSQLTPAAPRLPAATWAPAKAQSKPIAGPRQGVLLGS